MVQAEAGEVDVLAQLADVRVGRALRVVAEFAGKLAREGGRCGAISVLNTSGESSPAAVSKDHHDLGSARELQFDVFDH